MILKTDGSSPIRKKTHTGLKRGSIIGISIASRADRWGIDFE